MPATLNLEMYRGDTFRKWWRIRSVNVDGTSGDYLDLTGCTPLSQMRRKETSSLLQQFTCTLGDQTDPNTVGLVTIELADDQTATLPDGAIWDFQPTHPSGDTITYLAGKVTVTGQVSR